MSNAAAKPSRRIHNRIATVTTASIITFSLTLLAAAGLVILGVIPLNFLSFGQRVDVGALLLTVPAIALTLAVVFEATRIAIRSPDLPDSHRQPVVNWAVDPRER